MRSMKHCESILKKESGKKLSPCSAMWISILPMITKKSGSVDEDTRRYLCMVSCLEKAILSGTCGSGTFEDAYRTGRRYLHYWRHTPGDTPGSKESQRLQSTERIFRCFPNHRVN